MLTRNVGSAITDFFWGDPLTTPIGTLVEEATEDFVGTDLWQLFSEICNVVKQSPNGPKDAVRAIRRRFVTSANANEAVAMHTLLLLESCMINCGYRFHILVATKSLLQDITRFVSTHTAGVSNQVQKKLLSLIQTWSTQFASDVDLQEFVNIYRELKERNINFPTDTSSRSAKPPVSSPTAQPPTNNAIGAQSSTPEVATAPSTAGTTSGDTPKVLCDITQVRINVCTLSDLMSDPEVTSSTEGVQLMKEVAASLQEMSRRLIYGISCWEAYRETVPLRGDSDYILFEMINVNDELQTILTRYSRLVAQIGAVAEEPVADGAQPLQNQEEPSQSDGAAAAQDQPAVSGYDSFIGASTSLSQPQNTPVPQAPPEGDTVPLRVPGATALNAPTTQISAGATESQSDAKLIDF